MNSLQVPRCLPALCGVLILAACGGGGGGADAKPGAALGRAPIETTTPEESIPALPQVEPAPQPRAKTPEGSSLAGFANLGSTCYANSMLKLLIHSIGPQRLMEHLSAFAATRGAPERAAALEFIALIESSSAATGVAPTVLQNFFASLQQLPAFSSLAPSGTLKFSLAGELRDASEFLESLSTSFALGELYGHPIILNDYLNRTKSDEVYWTILQPAAPVDSLQDLFDHALAEEWLVMPGRAASQLTVAVADEHLFGTLNFDFNQSVQLRATDSSTAEPLLLTLEPREVVEFQGGRSGGHYLSYIKDGQWFRHDDHQVEALERMPAVQQVRFINFAVVSIEPGS